jgi:hypothetical protein
MTNEELSDEVIKFIGVGMNMKSPDKMSYQLNNALVNEISYYPII